MYASINIDKSGNRQFVNIGGTPEDLAKVMMDVAEHNDSFAKALAIIKAGTFNGQLCECGKLSKGECEMTCIANFPNVGERPVFELRTDENSKQL